ncbi:MAG: hypothetical protein H0X62_10240 [Bacteroidetes bacterium]|nr:hypothetical protein [Bacteroidota bacterium]
MKNLALIFTALIFISFSSCKKKKEEGESNASIQMANYFDAEVLNLNGKTYKTAKGDEVSITTFDYYISNIQLNAADNSAYVEKESYHLLKTSDAATLKFSLSEIPVNEYVSITFTIGVDSIRNVSGAQTGALDPAHGMFWTWNSGYIMAMLEGTSPQSTMAGNLFQFHIGGFAGENNVLKRITLEFPSPLKIEKGKTPTLNLKADAAQWFKSPNNIDLSITNNCQMPGACAKTIAGNYANMFSVISVNN